MKNYDIKSMMEIYNNHDMYFCSDESKIFTHNGTSLLQKTSNDFRIFCKTVLVHCNNEVKSIFD